MNTLEVPPTTTYTYEVPSSTGTTTYYRYLLLDIYVQVPVCIPGTYHLHIYTWYIYIPGRLSALVHLLVPRSCGS